MTQRTVVVLALQCAMGLLTLAFGVASLRVASRPGRSVRSGGWFLSGAAFTAVGALATCHSVAAVWAVNSGDGSGFYEGYVRSLPAANHSRGLVVLGFTLTLLAMLFRGRTAPQPGSVLGGIVLLLATGTALGMAEGEYAERLHYTWLSVLSVATAMLLFVTLYRALVTDALDYLLWVALAVYALREALTADLLAWMGFSEAWQPSPDVTLGIAAGSLVVMLMCALRRLALARAGRDAPALLERVRG